MRFKYLLVLGLLCFSVVSTASADECNPTDPTLLLPDLKALPPSRMHQTNVGGHRVLYFTTMIGNVGDGPMILHGHTITGSDGMQVTQASQEIFRSDGTSCTHVAGDFVYHPQHRHFHFEDFSDYLLRKDDPLTGEIVARSEKVSFCLLDVMRLPGYRTFPQFPNDCENPEGTQGISVGFADVYDFLLPGQNIDLDADPAHPVPDGNYFLVNVTNPDGIIWEKDSSLDSNAGAVSVRVNGGPPPDTEPEPTPPPPTASTPDPTPPPTPTPAPRTVRQPHRPHSPSGPVLVPRLRFPHAPHSPGGPRPIHAPHSPSVTARQLTVRQVHQPHAPRN